MSWWNVAPPKQQKWLRPKYAVLTVDGAAVGVPATTDMTALAGAGACRRAEGPAGAGVEAGVLPSPNAAKAGVPPSTDAAKTGVPSSTDAAKAGVPPSTDAAVGVPPGTDAAKAEMPAEARAEVQVAVATRPKGPAPESGVSSIISNNNINLYNLVLFDIF